MDLVYGWNFCNDRMDVNFSILYMVFCLYLDWLGLCVQKLSSMLWICLGLCCYSVPLLYLHSYLLLADLQVGFQLLHLLHPFSHPHPPLVL